jgi:hypothetical protein
MSVVIFLFEPDLCNRMGTHEIFLCFLLLFLEVDSSSDESFSISTWLWVIGLRMPCL